MLGGRGDVKAWKAVVKLRRMEFEDGLDDDPSSYRTPPPPDDRIWRHPSELASKARAGDRTWLVAVIAGMGGAMLATGMGFVAGGFGRGSVERVVDREVVPVPTVSPQPVASVF